MKSSVNFDHERAFSTFGLGERVSAREEGVNVWRMALLRLAHGASTSRLHSTSTSTSCAFYVHLYLHSDDKPRFDCEDD